MFDLRYGWRQWNKDKLQSFVLLTGLALFCAFSVNLVAVGPALFSDRPEWMADEAEYATIGTRSETGGFRPMSAKALAKFENAAGIDELMPVSSRKATDIEDQNGQPLKHVRLLYLPENFLTRYESRLPKAFGELSDSGVLVSRDFWRQRLQQGDLQNLSLHFSHNNLTLPVVGVLPEGFRLFEGGLQPDVLLTRRMLAATFGVKFASGFQPNEQQKRAIKNTLLSKAPIHYAIARLEAGFKAENVVASANDDAEPDESEVRVFTRGRSKSWKEMLNPGVEFAPKKRQQLQQQWWMLLGLSLAFLLLGLFNLLTSNFSRYLQRQPEFQTRMALGASPARLVRQLMLENALVGGLAAALGIIISGVLLYFILQELPFLDRVDSLSIIVAIGVCSGLVLTITMLVGIIPFLMLPKEVAFTRSKSQGESRTQSVLGASNMVVQTALSVTAIACFVSLLITQQQKLNGVPLKTDRVQFTYENSGDSAQRLDLDEWQAELTQSDVSFAYSDSSLVGTAPYSSGVSLESPDAPDAQPMYLMPVSANYFELLGIKNSIGQTRPGEVNQVVINRTAAAQLGFDDPQQALEQRLYVDRASSYGFIKDKEIRVVGVVPDLPHLGLNKTDIPLIYLRISSQGLGISSLSIISRPGAQEEVSAWLQKRSTDNGGFYQLSVDGDLWSLLKEQDSDWFLLSTLITVLTLLVCGLSATSLYYQVVGHMMVRSQKFAVMRAVGAQMGDIVRHISLSMSLRLVFGLAIGGGLIAALNDWFVKQFHAELWVPTHLAITVLLLMVLVMLSYVPAMWKQLAQPLQNVLRDE